MDVARLPFERWETLARNRSRARRCRWRSPGPSPVGGSHSARTSRDWLAIAQSRRGRAPRPRGGCLVEAPFVAHQAACPRPRSSRRLARRYISTRVRVNMPSAKAISGSVSIAGLTLPVLPEDAARAGPDHDQRDQEEHRRRRSLLVQRVGFRIDVDVHHLARAASRLPRRSARPRLRRDRHPAGRRKLPEHERRNTQIDEPARPTRSRASAAASCPSAATAAPGRSRRCRS